MDLQKKYDGKKAKHLIENIHFVLHCHHYNTVLHRAMVNTPFIDGSEFFFTAVRDDFYNTLKDIVAKKNITRSSDVITFCSEFYKYSGLGELDFSGLTERGGTVTALHSHMATGYKNKWGVQKKPVDDLGRGYITAVWAVAFGKNPDKCHAVQTRCISCGHPKGEFRLEV